MSQLRIGILGFQGDIEEHRAMTERALDLMGLEGEALWVKRLREVESLHGLIVPGGESTVMGRLAAHNEALEAVKLRGNAGMPILGSCSGMIMLAQRVYDRVVGETKQPTFRLMDITVERNAFGRQRESFEAELDIPVLGEERFRGVFIRAPLVREAGSRVEALCRLNDEVVAVQQGNLLATSFHPELTDDTRLHGYFLKSVHKYQQSLTKG